MVLPCASNVLKEFAQHSSFSFGIIPELARSYFLALNLLLTLVKYL